MGAGRLGDFKRTMLVVNPAELDSLTEAIEHLIDSTVIREALGTAARKVVSDFDWSTVGKRRAILLSEQFPKND